MEAGSKDRPPMLAPGNYVQWKSRIKGYIDTKPNHELIHYCLKNPPYKLDWQDIEVPVSEGSPITTTERIRETYKNVSQDIRDQLNAEAEAVQIILTGIDNNIYSTVDACPNAYLESNLYWKFGKFTSQDGESLESYYLRFYKMMNKLIRNQCKSQELKTISYHKLYDILRQHQHEVNEIRAEKIARIANPLALVAQQQPDYHPQTHLTHYTQNSSTRSQQAATWENVGSSVEEAGIQLNAEQADWRDDTDDDELEYQELKAPYMYMAQLQEVSLDAANSGPIFDDEPLQKVSNDDHYNVFAMESTHPDQSKSVHDTYPIEQDAQNMVIDSLDITYDREEIDQNDDDNDLAKERELLASLIKKLKCEIDESKNHNKFLETSNKVLIEKLKCEIDESKNHNKFLETSNKVLIENLKGEIEDFKTKNKSLESSNNFFKEANNKLSETNNLLYADYKKSGAELARRNSSEYASQMELECAKVRGDLLSYKMDYHKSCNKYTETINALNQTISKMKDKLFAHQETISILSKREEAQIKLYKTQED
nr:hypothetical protein [Tanacetum cinerariifolium]